MRSVILSLLTLVAAGDAAEARTRSPARHPIVWTQSTDLPAGSAPIDRDRDALVEVAPPPDSNVPDCRLIRSSGRDDLDLASCEMLRRRMTVSPALGGEKPWRRRLIVYWMKERPAEEASFGGATPIGPERWITFEDFPSYGSSGTLAMNIGISSEGRVSTCAVLEGSGDPKRDAKSCALMIERAIFLPALDANGNKIATRGVRRMHWSYPSN